VCVCHVCVCVSYLKIPRRRSFVQVWTRETRESAIEKNNSAASIPSSSSCYNGC